MLNNLLLGQTAEEKNFIEDLFSCYLYTGNGSTQTITNGIDLAGKGGLVWIKSRSAAAEHSLFDTARGTEKAIFTQSTTTESTLSGSLTAFNSDGYALGSDGAGVCNVSSRTYASWTFRKAPKFFDVVTYTGNGSTAGRTISHSLGVAPGLILIKAVDAATDWAVYHRSLGGTKYLNLNTTGAAVASIGYWNDTDATDTGFTIRNNGAVNANNTNYVAYLFAHDTTADGLIQCGSFSYSGATGASVSLGWEPQFILYKSSTANGGGTNWQMHDNMRGMPVPTQTTANLAANTSGGENTGFARAYPTATGFALPGGLGSDDTYIYLAIRRGPMRVPTDATKVYSGVLTNPASNTTTAFSPDLAIVRPRSGGQNNLWFDRMRGPLYWIRSDGSTAETSQANSLTSFGQNGVALGSFWSGVGSTIVQHFKRATGFFDVVCYNGVSNTLTLNHNLGVPPELIITKARTGTSSPAWYVAGTPLTGGFAGGNILNLNTTAAEAYQGYFSNPTSTTIFLQNVVARSGQTYVAYLFASCPGVSKVGSYTGNGSSQNIDCGFTNGARFVLIKRTDSTGDWYVWDTARGIVAANDPHLSLNSTAAEVTTNDSIDPLSSGFTVNQNATTNINSSGGTYLYLAIA